MPKTCEQEATEPGPSWPLNRALTWEPRRVPYYTLLRRPESEVRMPRKNIVNRELFANGALPAFSIVKSTGVPFLFDLPLSND